MADINNKIIINVEDNASNKLDNIQGSLSGLNQNQTRVIQSTKALSKETNVLNDGLLKNGGAMGLLSAATGGLAMDFKDAIEAIEMTGISLKGLRGAIIATGIGALAIAVLELVTNWDKWIGVIDGSTAAMEKLNKEIQINNTRREKSSLTISKTISDYEQEIRVLEAAGASAAKLEKAYRDLDTARQEQAQLDLNTAQANIAQLEQQLLKTDEYVELIDLLNSNLRVQASLQKDIISDEARSRGIFSVDEANKLVEGARRRLDLFLSTNEVGKQLLEQQKNKVSAQIALNTATTDPKVRAAQAESERRDRQKTKELENQKKLQDLINASLQRGEAAAKTLTDINQALIGLTINDLSPVYSKFRNLTDAYNSTSAAVSNLIKEINKLQGRLLSDEEKKRYDKLNESLQFAAGNYNLIRQSFRQLIDLNPDAKTGTWNKETFELNIELAKMKSNLDIISSSIMEYERAEFGEYQAFTSNNIFRLNNQLERQIRITKAQYEIDKKSREEKEESLNTEKAILRGRQETIKSLEVNGKKVGDYIDKLEVDIKNAGRDINLNEVIKFQAISPEGVDPLVEKYANQYFDLQDKINDFSRQNRELSEQNATANAQLEIDINKLKNDAIIEQERMAYEARYSAQEGYYNSIQTLASTTIGFMSQLQNEELIKDKDVRNILLVAQKGAEIAQVVIATARENSRLKMQAGEYKVNSLLYGTLSAALAPINPVAAMSYGAASKAYAAGSAASLGQIGINTGIAGATIASIIATTITSWNQSSSTGGGGSSAAGGGGGGAAPQFNIVGTSNNNQLAAAIASQQNQPIEAYVVGSKITTQQALDRNKINTATFL